MLKSPLLQFCSLELFLKFHQVTLIVNINNNHAAHKVTILQESIVLNVLNQNIGTPSLKNVLSVKLVTLGITSLVNAHAVSCQDQLLVINVSAQPQKLFGTVSAKPAHAQLIHSEITVLPAQPQEFGMLQLTNAFAKAQPTFGMETNASAQPIDMVQTVLNAQPQEDGIQLQTNVCAMLHSSGTDKTVFALNPTFYSKEDAENAQLDTNGSIINAKNATVTIKISKFTPVSENDRFIVWFIQILI